MDTLTSLEICAGAGGQAIGIHQAGFKPLALVEIDSNACNTLRYNRPNWHVIEQDVKKFNASAYSGVDLLAGGVPCPPFSIAGKQLGQDDERDLFPEALRLASECEPRAIMLENVKGILTSKFNDYRLWLENEMNKLGYKGGWKLLQAADYGVPQLRPRAIYVAFKNNYSQYFKWPAPVGNPPPTVGDTLFNAMGEKGWERVNEWREKANTIAPTLVGGSKKHGGADLGPTRAKKAWAMLGVDGMGITDAPPTNGFDGMPRLTVQMAALIQGFPAEWVFTGKKTPAYRQVGNAFPPPVAKAVATQIAKALNRERDYGQKNGFSSQTQGVLFRA